jgi:hypothetical protein
VLGSPRFFPIRCPDSFGASQVCLSVAERGFYEAVDRDRVDWCCRRDWCPAIAVGHAQQPSADLILTNGKISRLTRNSRSSQAVAVKGDRIIAVGTNQQIVQMGVRTPDGSICGARPLSRG